MSRVRRPSFSRLSPRNFLRTAVADILSSICDDLSGGFPWMGALMRHELSVVSPIWQEN